MGAGTCTHSWGWILHGLPEGGTQARVAEGPSCASAAHLPLSQHGSGTIHGAAIYHREET
jgi:hypothetical protein